MKFLTFLVVCISACAAVAQTVPQVPLSQTLFIGDSITSNWADAPIHVGFYGRQACYVRFALGTAIAQHPGIKRVVIEAGTDDIINGPGPGFECVLPNQDPVSSVVDMVKTIRAAGLQAFVLSILPISWNDRAGKPCDPLVPPFNSALQAAVTAAGAVWVDDYTAFNGKPQYQIDGVHPNEAGYHVIETIYAAASCAAAGCTATGTSTALTVSPTTVTRPGKVTVTAAVTPASATGSVSFFDLNNSHLLGTYPLSSAGTVSVTSPTGPYPLGTNPVFAEYSGDTDHLLSFSPIVRVTLQ